ncbi:MAG: methyltransferase domain-containing protein [Pseudomonadales bacterium]
MPRLDALDEPHMFEAYGLYLLSSSHRFVRRLKAYYSPSVHGHQTWRSSYLLMDYFRHHPLRKGARVMEVGCGWGPAGIFCARQYRARVTGVDMDEDVFPFLDVLAALNEVEITPVRKSFEQLKKRDLANEHTVIGSDICFWDSMKKPLFNLIRRALTAGVKQVVIADPGRPPFHALADRCEAHFNARVERWYALEPNRTEGYILRVRR